VPSQISSTQMPVSPHLIKKLLRAAPDELI
jgi:hypothetical protein